MVQTYSQYEMKKIRKQQKENFKTVPYSKGKKIHFEGEKRRTLCGIKIIHNTAVAFDPYEVTCIKCGDILETTIRGNIQRMKKIDKMMNRKKNNMTNSYSSLKTK